MKHLWGAFIFWAVSAVIPVPVMAQEENVSFLVQAQNDRNSRYIYNLNKSHVYQIRVVDVITGEKYSIGSAFRVAPDGLFITNYHVIADRVFSTHHYKIEYIHENGARGELSLKNIDVIHDLAVLAPSKEVPRVNNDPYLRFAQKPDLSKGQRIYSMGNPHDLGMLVIDGLFNGFEEKTFYRQILFSGSLNSGMSGGPAFDREGRIIGVNVANSDNDLSYLVPAIFVKQLLQKTRNGDINDNWLAHIEDDLLVNEQTIISNLEASRPWQKAKFDDITVPRKISTSLKCWGKTNEQKANETYGYNIITCDNENRIYLLNDFYTGSISYEIEKLESSTLNRLAFSELMEQYFDIVNMDSNRNSLETGPYQCKTDYVEISMATWKVAICARKYKSFKKIYDITMVAALLGFDNKGYLTELSLEGFTQDAGLGIIQKFLKAFEK